MRPAPTPSAGCSRPDDAFGYPVTMAGAALEPWNDAARAFLAHGARTPVRLSAALEADPQAPLPLALKGLSLLLLGRRELLPAATDAATRLARLADDGALTEREGAYQGALAAWLAGSLVRAADVLDRQLDRTPRDALAVKLVHAIRFMTGDADAMRASVERVVHHYGDDVPAAGYIQACHAFALEETGELHRAERVGRHAVTLTNDDAWGVHAVAHVLDMTGRTAEGRAWVMEQQARWSSANNFRFHVWWHLALFYLAEGRGQEAMELYDLEVRAERTDDFRDIANAASLLLRLELAGLETGGRWAELADLAERRAEDGSVIFADLHYGLAMVGAARDGAVERLQAHLAQMAQMRLTDMQVVAADAGLAMASSLAAFGRGDYERALQHYLAARPRLRTIGGSHTQRDVFHQLGIEAAVRAGHVRMALDLVDQRCRERGSVDAFAQRHRDRLGLSLAGLDDDPPPPATAEAS